MARILCEACGDDGRQTLAPAYRGGPPRVGAACTRCPRCDVCEERLASSPTEALQLDGWEAYCGVEHLRQGMRARGTAERALYAFDLLEAPPLGHAQLADLLRAARSWLSDCTRALLSLEAEDVAAVLEASAGTLRGLAGVPATVPVVSEMCVQCDRIAARRLDLAGVGGDTAAWTLCPSHARLEAAAIRRGQRHLEADELTHSPQLPLPLKPGIKKVRRSTRDRRRGAMQ